MAHAHGFADAAESLVGSGATAPAGSGGPEPPGTGLWMDLGSGGGIPGLVLAHRWPDREAVLLESNARRARFLALVVEDQGWAGRVRVVADRAERAGRAAGLRGRFSLVVARSFGSPPVTAECAAPFLERSGFLIVSEPPSTGPTEDGDDSRWPGDDLVVLGLEPLSLWRDTFGYRVLRQRQECPERFPRRVGVPAKRPLYPVDSRQ